MIELQRSPLHQALASDGSNAFSLLVKAPVAC